MSHMVLTIKFMIIKDCDRKRIDSLAQERHLTDSCLRSIDFYSEPDQDSKAGEIAGLTIKGHNLRLTRSSGTGSKHEFDPKASYLWLKLYQTRYKPIFLILRSQGSTGFNFKPLSNPS